MDIFINSLFILNFFDIFIFVKKINEPDESNSNLLSPTKRRGSIFIEELVLGTGRNAEMKSVLRLNNTSPKPKEGTDKKGISESSELSSEEELD